MTRAATNQTQPEPLGEGPNEEPAAAAVPVGDVVVELTAAERQRIMDGSATVTDVDRLYRQVGRKLRAALNGEGTE